MATERELEKVATATRREKRPLRGKDRIGLRVGKIVGRHKVGEYFRLEIEDECFTWARDEAKIAAEAAHDRLYALRTNVPAKELSAAQTIKAYKDLSRVERGFRCLKGVDLKIRPIQHRLADRVRAHICLCKLACYVEWHLRDRRATHPQPRLG